MVKLTKAQFWDKYSKNGSFNCWSNSLACSDCPVFEESGKGCKYLRKNGFFNEDEMRNGYIKYMKEQINKLW